jgi:hypothetical protein
MGSIALIVAEDRARCDVSQRAQCKRVPRPFYSQQRYLRSGGQAGLTARTAPADLPRFYADERLS